IFIGALTRPPTNAELSVGLDALRMASVEGEPGDAADLSSRETAVQDLLWAVFMMPEFLMVR
ncbi:MAG: hypothetical protein ACPHJ3_13035, partial [Rubripirellula sp.]